MPSKQKPLIIDRKSIEKEISAKDLTRRELYIYIFGDFIRGGFIFLSFFVDSMLLLYFTENIPFIERLNAIIYLFSGFSIYLIYATLLSFTIIILLIILEISFYMSKIRKTFKIGAK